MITVTVKNTLIGVCSDENTARSFLKYYDREINEIELDAIMEGKNVGDYKVDYMPLIDRKFLNILKGN